MNGARWLRGISATAFVALAMTALVSEASTAAAARPAAVSTAVSGDGRRSTDVEDRGRQGGGQGDRHLRSPRSRDHRACPRAIAFPAIAQDLRSAPVAITLTNTGTAGLTISNLLTRDIPDQRGIGLRGRVGQLHGAIPPGGSCASTSSSGPMETRARRSTAPSTSSATYQVPRCSFRCRELSVCRH